MKKMMPEGSVSETPLTEVFQKIAEAMDTGSLYLRRGQQMGVLDFLSGKLIGASIDGVGGFEAAVDLLSWEAGDYGFRKHSNLIAGKVGESADILFLQSKRRSSSRRADFDGVMALQSVARVDDLAQVGTAHGLTGDEALLLEWFGEERTVEEAVKLSGLPDERAAAALARLRRDELVVIEGSAQLAIEDHPLPATPPRPPPPPSPGSIPNAVPPTAASEGSSPEPTDDLLLLLDVPNEDGDDEDAFLTGLLEEVAAVEESEHPMSVDSHPDISGPDVSHQGLAWDAEEDAKKLRRESGPMRRRSAGAHPDFIERGDGAADGEAEKPKAKAQGFWKWFVSLFLWSDSPGDGEGAAGEEEKSEELSAEEQAFLSGEMIRERPPWVDAISAPRLDFAGLQQSLREQLETDKAIFPTDIDIDFVDRVIAESCGEELELPIFPDAARQLDQLLRQGEPSVAEAVEIIKREPDLVRRVWQAASNAAYAHQVGSLDHAVVRIGLDRLWRIGMSALLYSPLFRVRGYTEQAERVRNVSIVAAEVAAWLSNESTGDTYVAGLLHEVGRLFVYRCAVVRPGQDEPSKDVVDWIADRYYPWFSVLIASTWGLSEDIQAAVGHHPEPENPSAGEGELPSLVKVGQVTGHMVVARRRMRDCGGEEALKTIRRVDFDVDKTLERANEALDALYDRNSAA